MTQKRDGRTTARSLALAAGHGACVALLSDGREDDFSSAPSENGGDASEPSPAGVVRLMQPADLDRTEAWMERPVGTVHRRLSYAPHRAPASYWCRSHTLTESRLCATKGCVEDCQLSGWGAWSAGSQDPFHPIQAGKFEGCLHRSPRCRKAHLYDNVRLLPAWREH